MDQSFCSRIGKVRQEGFCFDHEEFFEGVRFVSALIFNYAGKI
ncbi:MAG: hypothetical protein IJU76_01800 [Desulfovibrionaceae bacterium]|nr:hypothetical protein [Desulfovibrionaceae bacterium]